MLEIPLPDMLAGSEEITPVATHPIQESDFKPAVMLCI
jgi:hypothetical protein